MPRLWESRATRLFYRGDFKSAHASYAQALQAATRSKEPDTILIAKANLAKVAVQEKRRQEAIASLRPLIQQADELGLKYVSVESSIFMAEAMMQNHDNAHAQQELDEPCCSPTSLDMQPLSATCALFAGRRSRGIPATRTKRGTIIARLVRLLDAMKKDPGAEKLLQRADFKAIYEASQPPARRPARGETAVGRDLLRRKQPKELDGSDSRKALGPSGDGEWDHVEERRFGPWKSPDSESR